MAAKKPTASKFIFSYTQEHDGNLPMVCILCYSIQGVPGECARLRENVPYVKVHRYNPKHPYPKLNGYGDNGERSLKV